MSDKKEIIFICPNCNTTPLPDPERSNENWKVFDPKCPECGANYEIKLVSGTGHVGIKEA